MSSPASMAVLTLEQKLDLGASDLRFLLTNHGIKDDHQGALFEAGIDRPGRGAKEGVQPGPRYFFGQPGAGGQLHRGMAECAEFAKPIPTSDYIAMRQRFAKAFGEPENRHIPAKEYIEKKLAELEAGEFRAETLGEVLSRDEVDPDVLVPHWDAKGHLSVKKGSSSVAMPTGPEQLRLRLTVMYNALAMIKLKHPGRNELTDINADLIEKYKDYLLGDYVYGLRSAEAAGSIIPPWTLVLGYEHAIRKFANKLVSQKGYKFGEALKKAWKDATIKERHFSMASVQLSRHSRRGPKSPVRAARKVARRALRVQRGSRLRTLQARAPLGRPITIPSASATMLKAAARKELSVISLTFARYASGNTRGTSAPPLPRKQPTLRVPKPDLGRPIFTLVRHPLWCRRTLIGPCEFCIYSRGCRESGICRAA